jgi:hypothetical protein
MPGGTQVCSRPERQPINRTDKGPEREISRKNGRNRQETLKAQTFKVSLCLDDGSILWRSNSKAGDKNQQPSRGFRGCSRI